MDGLLFAGTSGKDSRVTFLSAEGFEVVAVDSIKKMESFLLDSRPRMMVICDEPLAHLKAARLIDTVLPVVVLGSKKAKPDEEEHCLAAGADAYVRNPASDALVVAWVEATFRRLERCPWGQERYGFGDVEVDVFRRSVMRRGWRIVMSATEFDLLVHLIRNHGRVVSREEILREVWKYDTCPTTRTVDNFICKLRRKIQEGSDADYLKTVKGIGYRFDFGEI